MLPTRRCSGESHPDTHRSGRRLPVAVNSPVAPSPDRAVDAQVLAELLDITQQALGGIAGQADGQVAGVRHAAAAVALIEEHNPVRSRIEIPSQAHRAT